MLQGVKVLGFEGKENVLAVLERDLLYSLLGIRQNGLPRGHAGRGQQPGVFHKR